MSPERIAPEKGKYRGTIMEEVSDLADLLKESRGLQGSAAHTLGTTVLWHLLKNSNSQRGSGSLREIKKTKTQNIQSRFLKERLKLEPRYRNM